MGDESLLQRVRHLWAELAGAPVGFVEGEADVAVSPGSRLCPPGWAGIVTLGGATIATAPDEESAGLLRPALKESAELAVLWERLPIADVLGPATLAYCDATGFRPVPGAAAGVIEAAGLEALRGRVSAEDDGEGGLGEISSRAFGVREKGLVLAAAGYEVWPHGTAHLSVLTDPEHRGRGLARRAASAAVGEALEAGLLPQWRARPEASRRVARALGFRELGVQVSVRLA
ncbi:GNAT family N-acetyltransferase [Actinoplanes sp. LDG1-06]|uniref:GNAT family N-acetyltransferase n=1 Tax=Paractinoplanes ovalisporus TaxID=2810368 RepID=A0ABS2ATS2_9ACTN|nr:GNAT family N-acetyltransferase [Actinoplanes ovalisporus]MBM2623118.1 GNAT family N-acetyltransferase [Actinoplanes ovalisporus]